MEWRGAVFLRMRPYIALVAAKINRRCCLRIPVFQLLLLSTIDC